MQSELIFLDKQEFFLYKPDILIQVNKRGSDSANQQFTLQSAVVLHPHYVTSFKTLRHAYTGLPNVKIFRKTLLTTLNTIQHNIPNIKTNTATFAVIFDEIQNNKTLHKPILFESVQRINKARTHLISMLKGEFQIELLEKKALWDLLVYQQYDYAYLYELSYNPNHFLSLANLDHIPVRDLPQFPQSFHEVHIPLGTKLGIPFQAAGLSSLPNIFLMVGSNPIHLQESIITLIHSLKENNRKIIVLDLFNEFKLPTSKNKSTYRLGENLSLNVCQLKPPKALANQEDNLIFSAEMLTNWLVLLSQNPILLQNVSLFLENMYTSFNALDSENISFPVLLESKGFTEVSPHTDQTIIELFQAEICQYASHCEINASTGFLDLELLLEDPFSILHICGSTQNEKVNQLIALYMFYHLLEYLTAKTVLILSHRIIPNISTQNEAFTPLFNHLFIPVLEQLLISGSLVISSTSPMDLPAIFEQNISSGLIHNVLRPLDQEWCVQHFNLKPFLTENHSVAFLAHLNRDALLIHPEPPNSYEYITL